MRGQVFITYRYADPHRADDAWAYDPQSRRVRRVSVEVKSDSVEGTDTTQEDFYTFSGRELHWHWKFLGWKDVLAVSTRATITLTCLAPTAKFPTTAGRCGASRWSNVLLSRLIIPTAMW